MKHSTSTRLRGVTLVEVVISIALIGMLSASTIHGLMYMNNTAFLSRLHTGAGTVAQNQIDLILSIQPYNPQKNQIPPELVTGSRMTGSRTAPTIPIYTDPTTGQTLYRGWMVTDVADQSQTVNGVPLHLRRANVTVFYEFRTRVHSIQMTTLRVCDI